MSSPTPDAAPALVEVTDLEITFGTGRRATRVLHGVSTRIRAGHTVGLVGESGSGKSTLAKALVGLVRPSAGRLVVDGVDLAHAARAQRRQLRRSVQLIPQDPYSSLDPRRTVGQAIAEAVDPASASVRRNRDAIAHWLTTVRLPADAADRYPHEFSGGQRQRIAIARGLAVQPRLVVADEITSALDVSVQAEILALLADLRERLALTMLFISHDLAVVRQVCDDVAVMYQGEIVEQGPAGAVYTAPRHAYTRSLLDSVPGSASFSLT